MNDNEDYQKFINEGDAELKSREKTIRPGSVKPVHLGARSQGWYTMGGTGLKTLDVDARLDTPLADILASLIEALIEKGVLERLRDTSHLEQEGG